MNWIGNFHFIRPEWLFALIPAVVIAVLLFRRYQQSTAWADTIDPTLMPFLLIQPPKKTERQSATYSAARLGTCHPCRRGADHSENSPANFRARRCVGDHFRFDLVHVCVRRFAKPPH